MLQRTVDGTVGAAAISGDGFTLVDFTATEDACLAPVVEEHQKLSLLTVTVGA